MSKYYKFLNAVGLSSYQGMLWPKPGPNDTPGDWVEVEGPLSLCENGLHACEAEHILHWGDSQMYELEYDGEILTGIEEPYGPHNKVVGRKARLVRHIPTWNLHYLANFHRREAWRLLQILVEKSGATLPRYLPGVLQRAVLRPDGNSPAYYSYEIEDLIFAESDLNTMFPGVGFEPGAVHSNLCKMLKIPLEEETV